MECHIREHGIPHIRLNGTVKAFGGEKAAGLGGGSETTGGVDISIYGGNVHAEGGKYGAGIGVGYNTWEGGKLHVYDGTVVAKGGAYGAGIGGGQSANGLDVTVDGGHVDAYGGTDAAGIGTGENYRTGCGTTYREGSIPTSLSGMESIS